MIHKKLLTLVLALTLTSSVTQVFTVTYPSKRILKKADHIASLATTVTFISTLIAYENKSQTWGDRLLTVYMSSLGVQGIINGMALKHERSIATILKCVLPLGTIGGWTADLTATGGTAQEYVGFHMGLAGAGINGIKNIWDIYSLVQMHQNENTTDGNEISPTV